MAKKMKKIAAFAAATAAAAGIAYFVKNKFFNDSDLDDFDEFDDLDDLDDFSDYEDDFDAATETEVDDTQEAASAETDPEDNQ